MELDEIYEHLSMIHHDLESYTNSPDSHILDQLKQTLIDIDLLMGSLYIPTTPSWLVAFKSSSTAKP